MNVKEYVDKVKLFLKLGTEIGSYSVSEGAAIHVSAKRLIQLADEASLIVDIEYMNDQSYPYRLRTTVDNVPFIACMSQREFAEWKKDEAALC
ncbi:hypothetical protein SAMN05446037_100643 [Anaerovirgula multivorans]|uniref:Uncharacterized protein n=1 Tax=Anaerovirgula multivorans TaxID=312168 RepID=A0A239CN53_9FIRM|nr:hypothetical protein [Anaerovirgula multivorans]SNS21158.1 hypothetical protein SAMN05446037_100643 [Anaerovirgula multivorans]